MTFSELLNQYLKNIGCSAKELADASGISSAVISRYRSGVRVPTIGSDNLAQLSKGIAYLQGHTDVNAIEEIEKSFIDILKETNFDYDRFADNLNLLIEATDLNINRLARFMNYDASFISRIRARQRRPAKPEVFVDGICRFVCTTLADKKADIATLIGKSLNELEEQQDFYNTLRFWLCYEKSEKEDSTDRFLNMLDSFDLNDYIRSIKFDELKIPSVPFQFKTSKNYYGLEEMRLGELDFLKATVLSRSNEPVFMCSDMDMEDMSKDKDFAKKWMYGVAMCLKKGLHLNIIHTIDRPINEMMLGLEGWIPIYMTGQISPYYLKNARSNVYQHLNYVSGSAALNGECIAGHHDKGKYYLTKKNDEIAYYHEKSEFILKKALPLMEIYRKERRQQYERFLENDAQTSGKRYGILSVPPLYTIPEDLLNNILSRNDISSKKKQIICDYVKATKKRMEIILQNNEVTDEISRLSSEEFNNHPACLSIEGLFDNNEIKYSYEDYLKHIEATVDYAKTHTNYHVSFSGKHTFRSIQIFIHEGEFAMVSKSNAPVVHFVIHQPKLREAIENMTLSLINFANNN